MIERREKSREIYCLLRKLVRESPKFYVVRQHTPSRETQIAKDEFDIRLVLARE